MQEVAGSRWIGRLQLLVCKRPIQRLPATWTVAHQQLQEVIMSKSLWQAAALESMMGLQQLLHASLPLPSDR
jgi:hypothetical protein